MKAGYTQIIFKTPEDRVRWCEGSVEILAESVVEVFQGLTEDPVTGCLILNDALTQVIAELNEELAELTRAREACK